MLINDIIVETVTVYYKTAEDTRRHLYHTVEADKIAKNKVKPILWDTL